VRIGTRQIYKFKALKWFKALNEKAHEIVSLLYQPVYQSPCTVFLSAGLTLVANVAIATVPAFLGPRGLLYEICSSLYARLYIRI